MCIDKEGLPIWGRMLPVLDCKVLTILRTSETSSRFSTTGVGVATAEMMPKAKKEATMRETNIVERDLD